MRDFSQLDWIVEKASEVLVDKVKDAPLSDADVEMAFELFASKRLQQISRSLEGEADAVQARNYILMKLQERAKQLNLETWERRNEKDRDTHLGIAPAGA